MFCHCDIGWTGKYCELSQENNCSCASDSICLFNRICLCPMNRFGQRCYLSIRLSLEYSCDADGTFIPIEPRADISYLNYVCLCSNGYYEYRCDVHFWPITISFQDIPIPSLILLHFVQTFEKKDHQRTVTFKKSPSLKSQP